ncbi:YchJ family protein [Vibrio sp. RC27]
MKHCPCGSKKHYKNCCQLVHNDHAQARKPEQLMRARYCAHVLNLVDFIIMTYHPDRQQEFTKDDIQEGCELEWTKLVVEHSHLSSNTEGFVHFKAYYNDNGQSQCLNEKSRFIKHKGFWFYVDGTY